jgi:hypothetical protein
MKTRVAYLIQRGPTFQLLLPIPRDLHEQFRRKDLRWSLQTGDLRIVQRKALRPLHFGLAGSRGLSVACVGETRALGGNLHHA